ncbi:DUF6491 family protein [Stenotrophomonas lacuserhaii]|uniref:DUF6491 family protein n=1 Tax=Stenotrophomonas lacuserhaii TaxID=2760084 RepID=UPI002948BFBF|nr:DUF6491 family protein [Stenotrophomonas lacuserhaii]
MINTLRLAPLALACLLPAVAQAAPAAAAPARSPPAPHCLDARDVRQLEQASPESIAVRRGNGVAYRIDFSGAGCPGVNDASQVRLEAPAGWACGRPSEQVVVDGRSCGISAVSVIDNREFAEAARESSRQFASTLPGVTVTGKSAGEGGGSNPQHTFQGAADFCFATRHVRSWNEDPQGVVVETNPRRNGGNRYYRVELGGSCSILAGAQSVDFQSGFQNGLICGNPGDRIVMVGSMDGDLRSGTPRFARPGCEVLAVYPTH